MFPFFEKPGQFIQSHEEFLRKKKKLERVKAVSKENRKKLEILLMKRRKV